MPGNDPYAAIAQQDPYAAIANNGSAPAAPALTPEELHAQATSYKPPAPVSGWRRFASAAIAPIKGAVQSFSGNPTPDEAAAGLTTPYDVAMRPVERFVESQAGQVNEAENLAKQGRYSEAAAHGLASIVPLLGPWVADAAQTYYDQLNQGDIPSALGTAAGNMALAFAPDAIRKGTSMAKNMLRGPAQTLTGTGPYLTRDAVAKANADFQDAQNDYQQKLTKAQADHQNELLQLKQQYDQSVRDAQAKANTGTAADKAQYDAQQLAAKQKYDQAVRDSTQKFEAAKQQAEQANADVQRQYNQKVGKTIQQNRQVEAAQQAEKQRQGNLQVQGSQLMNRLNQLEQNVRQQANAKYDAVRQAVGDDSVPREPLAQEVESAQDQWIKGSPENIKEFRAIVRPAESTIDPSIREYANKAAQAGGWKDFIDAWNDPSGEGRDRMMRGLDPQTINDLTTEASQGFQFNDLQGFYEELNRKLSQGGMPSDVYNAVKQVRDAVGKQMGDLAQKHNAGPLLNDARNYYRNFMETFHEPTGPSGSGSPVAQALLAKDPLLAIDPFSGKSGDRGVAMLRRYDPDIADLAQQAQRNARGKAPAPRAGKTPISSIPAPKSTPVPSGANLPLPPVMENQPAPRAANLPLPPVLPEMEPVPEPEPPTVNPQQLKQQELMDAARGIRRLKTGDAYLMASAPVTGGVGPAIALGRKYLANILEHPMMMDWLTQPSEKEMNYLRNLPPESQAAAREQIQEFLAKQKAPVKLSPAMQAFLNGGRTATYGGASASSMMQDGRKILANLPTPSAP